MRELLGVPQKEYPAIETGLSLLPMLTPETAAALLDARLVALDAEIAERNAVTSPGSPAAGVPELFMIEFHYRQAILAAERDFIAALAGRIRDRSIGGMEMWEQLHRLLSDGLSMDDIRKRVAAGDYGQEVANLLST